MNISPFVISISKPRTVLGSLALALTICLPASAQATPFLLSATLTGAQEVPPNASPATGSLAGTYDDVTNALDFTVNFSGLLSPTNNAHFHASAPPGVNAPVVIGFVPGFPLGVTSGTYSNLFTLTAAQETALLGGLMYINIHTNQFPGGEIRGQLAAVPSTAAVPEPATLALLGSGLMGLLVRRRLARKP